MAKDCTPEEIAAAKAILTPEIIAKIAGNEMPECFTPDRASYVAIAQCLNDALTMIEGLVRPASIVVPDKPKLQ